MASTKTTVSLALALLATAFVLSTSKPAVLYTSTSKPAGAVNPFCDTADDKALCTQLTKGAKTWAEAMTNALNGVMERANAGKAIVDSVGSKLPGNLRPQTKESIDSTCHEDYEDILDNIKHCIGFVKNDPYSSLNIYLSAISFSECTNGLKEFGVSLPQVDQFDQEISNLSSTLLAVAQKKA